MKFRLIIDYDAATNNVNVSGPIENKALCYLMMECAKDAVRDHVAKLNQGEGRILPASFIVR